VAAQVADSVLDGAGPEAAPSDDEEDEEDDVAEDEVGGLEDAVLEAPPEPLLRKSVTYQPVPFN